MVFSIDAPPIRASYFSRPAGEIAGLVLHAVADGILQGRETPEGPDITRRFDYVFNGSRIGLEAAVSNGGTVVVTYSAGVLNTVAGLVAVRLQRWLGVDVTVGAYQVGCTVSADHKVERFLLGRCPTPDVPEDGLAIVAERHFDEVVGPMIDGFRALADASSYQRRARPCWKDKVYGVVGLNADASFTYERMPGEDTDSPRTNQVCTLTVRILQDGRDLLPHMVDIAAFARRYGLVLIHTADDSGYWKFLFVNENPPSAR